jgi:hypothetical protein
MSEEGAVILHNRMPKQVTPSLKGVLDGRTWEE